MLGTFHTAKAIPPFLVLSAEIDDSLVASVPQVVVEGLQRFALVLAADAICLAVQREIDMFPSGQDDII